MTMDKATLEGIIRAISSTNLGLQNSLGNYAKVAADAISILTAQPTTEARLLRIENRLDVIGNMLNGLRFAEPPRARKRKATKRRKK